MSIIKKLKSINIKAMLFLIFLLVGPAAVLAFLKVSWIYIAAFAVLVILIFIIVLLLRKMKNIQKAANIEKSIGSNDLQLQSLSPEKKSEIEQFKKQLEAAISSLKNSKIGKGKSGKAALYALPWYMIIGPSAAGKTTAIKNSGLEFPFGREGFRGVGSTRNCDWFFSTKGIFLDTAGRYVTDPEDRIEWISFLNVIKKNRQKRPINGVLIALNIDEIINCDKNGLYEHAKNIRVRIDELISNLGVNFPVYFIFTKMDLVQGFVEYFSDFSEIERSQLWGATFSSDQIINGNAKDLFDNEFNRLADKLYEIRTIRLSGPLKREQRRKVYLFPFQFKSLSQKLSFLISEVFQHNPYQDNPLFRGFYFTSGTQEGVPLDLAIKEIAKQFNLPLNSDFSDEETEIIETKHYFIKDLLNDTIIGDRNFNAGQSSGYVKKENTLRLAFASGSILVLLLFGLLTQLGYNGSKEFLDKTTNTATAFANINWTGNLLNNFRTTENLRTIISDIEHDEAVKSTVSFGMDRSEQPRQGLENLFIAKTNIFFSQNIYGEIERVLNNFANGEDYSVEEIYNYLKTYLLIGNERARLNEQDQKFISRIFSDILKTRYINQNLLASSHDRDSLKIFFDNYLNFVSGRIKDRNIYPVKNDDLLISLVRSRLQYQPGVENIYARLKQNGIHQFSNDLTLEQIIGGRFSSLINSSSTIPYIFTADGWKKYVEGAIVNESVNPGKEDWVLGKNQVNTTFANLSSSDIQKQLVLLYLNDYKQIWMQFVQSLNYSGFESVPLAANNLKILSDPANSPLILVLKTFATQLQVIVDIISPNDSAQIKQAAFRPDDASFDVSEVNKYRSFVLAPDGSISPNLNAIIAQYGLLSGILESIKGGPDLTKDYVVKLLNQRSVEFPTALQEIKGAVYQTASLQYLFAEPVKRTWSAMLKETSLYLNSIWKSRIVDIYNKSLMIYFPFKENGADLPFEDFKEFFKPQSGTLWSFVNNELSSFINIERWKVNQWENEGVDISNEVVVALKKANDISNTLFRNGELNVSFRLKPMLPESRKVNETKPIVEQVFLSLDNVENYYKMGTAFWTDYSWPGNRGVPGARMNISIRGYGNSETKSYDGEWALFRLFREASVSPGETSSQFIFNWFFKKENEYDVVVTYLMNTGSSKNPFSSNFFKSFHLPERIN